VRAQLVILACEDRLLLPCEQLRLIGSGTQEWTVVVSTLLGWATPPAFWTSPAPRRQAAIDEQADAVEVGRRVTGQEHSRMPRRRTGSATTSGQAGQDRGRLP
jgi:hypothetical protein